MAERDAIIEGRGVILGEEGREGGVSVEEGRGGSGIRRGRALVIGGVRGGSGVATSIAGLIGLLRVRRRGGIDARHK